MVPGRVLERRMRAQGESQETPARSPCLVDASARGGDRALRCAARPAAVRCETGSGVPAHRRARRGSRRWPAAPPRPAAIGTWITRRCVRSSPRACRRSCGPPGTDRCTGTGSRGKTTRRHACPPCKRWRFTEAPCADADAATDRIDTLQRCSPGAAGRSFTHRAPSAIRQRFAVRRSLPANREGFVKAQCVCTRDHAPERPHRP